MVPAVHVFCRFGLGTKEKVTFNPPVGTKSHKQARIDANLKFVSPAEQVCEFPNEILTVSAGKLFCIIQHNGVNNRA